MMMRRGFMVPWDRLADQPFFYTKNNRTRGPTTENVTFHAAAAKSPASE
jgi:hypothetical protein